MDHINHNKLNIFNIKVYIHVTFLSSCFKNFTSEFLQINVIKYINNLIYVQDLYFTIYVLFLCIYKNILSKIQISLTKKD